MSTSPRRVPAAATSAEAATVSRLEPFPYDLVVETTLAVDIKGAAGPETAGANADVALARATQESQTRADARREGQAEAQKSFEGKLAKERLSIAAALAQFTQDRANYFQKVEGEVVQLALSIARKILHREAQLDPMLLAGIVRVALEKVDAATGVVLRLHPQQSADWRQFLATQLEPADLPEVVEDASQPLDTCVLETAMGCAPFGLDIQLKEIEHGLMDLLAARPGGTL